MFKRFFISLKSSSYYSIGGVYTTPFAFSTKNVCFGGWENTKFLKTGFKVHVFENDTVIVSM